MAAACRRTSRRSRRCRSTSGAGATKDCCAPSTTNSSWRRANGKAAKPARRPASSTASRSRPPKAAESGASTPARRSWAASATSSSTRWACWSDVVVHAADIQDRDGAPAVLRSILKRWPWLRHVFADGGYAGPKLRGALQKIGSFTLEIIKRSDSTKGFEVLPRRWVVERTFAWLGRCRRLAKDFERIHRIRRGLGLRRQASACSPDGSQGPEKAAVILIQTLEKIFFFNFYLACKSSASL